MKKYVFIILLFLISISLSISLVYNIKQKKQIEYLKSELSKIEEIQTPTEQKDDIEIKVEKCIEINYTTAGMNECVYASQKDWENKINESIKLLKDIMTNEQYELLQISQKEWEEYKNSQWTLNGKTIGTMTGSLYTNILASNQVSIVGTRAKELESLYYFFSRK